MRKVNTAQVEPLKWQSPKGKLAREGIEVSEALGRERQSTDLTQRHPFDVEILRIPPGKAPYPYHSHSAQWEFCTVISGGGSVRHEGGTGSDDLVLYVVADNPIGESWHYPYSNKVAVQMPQRRTMRSGYLDYFDGEE